MSEAEYAAQRNRMVVQQIEGRGIYDAAILRAMRQVPREHFVPDPYKPYAYDDTPLPIPGGQTISQPYVVALMIEALRLDPDDRVLEVGTGSGYAAAVLSRIVAEVYTVERLRKLVDYASKRLLLLGYDNVRVAQRDGTLGWLEYAPYDGIIVAAGGPNIPNSLRVQLAVGGRLVMPVGDAERRQQLICLTRRSETDFVEEDMGPVKFVPLIGAAGWQKGRET